ncbi:flagellar motor protein MotB [Bacillus sp. AFS073361]|uniref:OmpA/MotB family protein n=1 Tax=Bacillus sp. AFS073361 TaxID=2033511 RepID=UPI000BF256DD|nr:flagellar motor protein MotB [Bacillus sp. AFS073361]PFP30809.1 flagellar motor protein MotB [Bacillus sp. AFS073361]
MAKKKLHEEHEEHVDESWLIPYADLLTLLLALFIVLFAQRSEDTAKTSAMMESLYNAFNTVSVFETNSGGQTPSNTNNTNNEIKPEPIPNPKSENKDKKDSEDEKRLQQLMKRLQKFIDENKLNAEISLTDLREGIQITLKDRIVFDSGSDHINRNFDPILEDIVKMLKMVDNSIIIEGHTDNQPIHSSNFPSNWELSSARALSVVHYFQNHNIAPNRLRFSGYGEFKPVYPNNTPEHREANRRVNIIILRK